MKVLYFADIFGKPGRRAVAHALPSLREKYQPDFIIGNAENLAGGRGVNRKTFNEMMELGFHAMTSGNHIWDNRDVYSIIDSDPRLLRPANCPTSESLPCPGRGTGIFESNGKKLFLVNLMGRVFMDAMECPFNTADRLLSAYKEGYPILVDMHADATSEKTAMGWHLDGRVSAVVGSHSHVQTADEQILPKGTAYITDVGMSGSFHSCIGLKPTEVIRKFQSKRPHHYQSARENPGVGCVIIDIDEKSRVAKSIERLRFTVGLSSLASEGDLE